MVYVGIDVDSLPSTGLPPAPICSNGQWTEFFDTDNPDGDGDFEILPDINFQFPGRVCSNPTAVDAQLVPSGKDYRSVGQVVRISLSTGFTCLNREQPNSRACLDYRVRFCCPSKCLKVPITRYNTNITTCFINKVIKVGLNLKDCLISKFLIG